MTIHARTSSFATRLALLAACAAIPLAGAACEDQQAAGDRQIQEAIQQSGIAANSEDGSPAKAIPALAEAAAVSEASPLYRAQAQALLGQASYTAAMELVPELNTRDVQIGQLLRQISRLSTRVLESSFDIEAMRGTNPQQPKSTFQQSRESFAKRLAELDGGIAEARKNLEAKRAQIEQLEASRLAAANQSTELTLKSEQARGQDALKIYNQALEARQQASMLAHQLELAKMDLVRLEQVVEGLQAQRVAAADGLKTAEAQTAKLDQGWTETQKLIERQVQATQKMLEESGIASRAADLKKTTDEAEALRKQVNENLSRAIEAYGAADNAAVALEANMRDQISTQSNAPEQAAWESIQKTINSFTYDIARSKALFARAHIAMAERSLLDARRGLAQRLVPIFQQAKLEVPAELTGADLDERIGELTKQAGEDLQAAEEALKDVVERAQSTQDQNAARFMLMAVQYANYHLSDNASALASAKSELQALMQASILLPALPSDLEGGVITRAVTPATGPAGAETGAGGGGDGSTWLKILQRASQPFGGGAGNAPGGGQAMPPGAIPGDPSAPAPDNATEPTPTEPPAGREPGGNLAPPTGIDF